ncbi:MAG: DUF1801 domain-containing protein, partial [Actinomycetota bacterium]|nr:DUF1801 domain-containing protein [Actinomycetota bacterium]
MAENKTQKTKASVNDYIDAIDDPRKRDDSKALVELMQRVTGEQPAMWGESIVGFCDFHYRSAAGREGDWFKVGFSPRKQNLTLYLALVDVAGYDALLSRLGKHSTGKSC